MQHITDEDLFTKVIYKNDEEAMEIIIHRYNKLIYKFIYNKLGDYYLSQDLCQEIFIKVYEKRDTFNPDYTFKCWIYKIATNSIIDYLRSKEYKNKKQASEVLEDVAITEDFNIIEYKMLQNDINDALKNLKEDQQEVVKLRFYEDFSLKEISYITESNLNTVKARLYSGIKYLKQALKRDYGGEKIENANKNDYMKSLNKNTLKTHNEVDFKNQNNINILNDIEELNLYDDISLEDIELIEKNLINNIEINTPNDLAENIINCVMPLMHENHVVTFQCNSNKVFFLLRQIKNQILVLNKAFYISIALILTSSLLLNTYGYFNEIYFFSPLISVFEVFYSYRGVYYKVYEMELCCKNSTFEITLSRTIIILAINVILSFIIGILNIFMGLQLPFFYVITTWLAPMIVTYYIALYFLINKNLKFSVIFGSSAWVSYVVLHSSFIGENLIYNKTIFTINLSLIMLALVLLSYLLMNTKKEYNSQ